MRWKIGLDDWLDHSAITCEEIIDVEAKLNDEKAKKVSTNFNKKNEIAKHEISMFCLHFY